MKLNFDQKLLLIILVPAGQDLISSVIQDPDTHNEVGAPDT